MSSRRIKALARALGLADNLDEAAVLGRLGRTLDGIGAVGEAGRIARGQITEVLKVLKADGLTDLDNVSDLRRLAMSTNASDIAKYNRVRDLIRNGGRLTEGFDDVADMTRRMERVEKSARRSAMRLNIALGTSVLGTMAFAGVHAFAIADKKNGGEYFRQLMHSAKDSIIAGYHAVEDMDKTKWLAEQIHMAEEIYSYVNPELLDLGGLNTAIDGAMSREGATKEDGMNAALLYRIKDAPLYMMKFELRQLILDEIHKDDPEVDEHAINKMLAEGFLEDILLDTDCAALRAHGIEINDEKIIEILTSDDTIIKGIPPRMRDGLVQLYPDLHATFERVPPIIPSDEALVTIGNGPLTSLADNASDELRSYREIGDAYFGKGYNTGATLANGNQVVIGDTARILKGAATFYDGVRNGILRDNPDMDSSADAVADPQTRFAGSVLIAEHINANNGYIDVAGIEAQGIDLNIAENFSNIADRIASIPNLEQQPWYQDYADSLSDLDNDQDAVIDLILTDSMLYGMGANGIQYWLSPEEYQQAFDALTDNQKTVAMRPEIYEQVIHPEVVEPAYARNPELAEMHNNARTSTAAPSPTVDNDTVVVPATLEDFAASASAEQLADMSAIANGSWRNASKERLDSLFNTASGLINSGAIKGPENQENKLGEVFDFMGLGFVTDFFSSNPIERFNAFASILPIIEFIGMIPGLDGFADMLKEKVQRIALDVIDEKVDAATDNPAIRGALERIGADADLDVSVDRTNTGVTNTGVDQPEVESRFIVPGMSPGA